MTKKIKKKVFKGWVRSEAIGIFDWDVSDGCLLRSNLIFKFKKDLYLYLGKYFKPKRVTITVEVED